VRLVRPLDRDGFGLDGLWNDDFHHSARVALTGRREAYIADYRGSPQELISALKWGYLYQGQRYAWHRKRRGTPTFDVPPAAFVTYLENHDQIANSGQGEHLHWLANPGRLRALTALWLLGPGTPMLFQGQEFACTAPFRFFADHSPDLARLVRKGRGQSMAQFAAWSRPEAQAQLPDPGDPATFEVCKLEWSECEKHAHVVSLHRDLLRLRREDAVFRGQRLGGVDGAVLGPTAFAVRFFGNDGDDRLMLINLGADLTLDVVPEPLLAPPAGGGWRLLWSSEDPRYGTGGASWPETEQGWRLPGESAVVLAPGPDSFEAGEGSGI
jgi:maltooligosyltrehalose trehalohydrolase